MKVRIAQLLIKLMVILKLILKVKIFNSWKGIIKISINNLF